jgi:hypothetical protein
LGDPHPFGRAGEMLFLGDGHEVFEMPQFHDSAL